MADIFAKNKGGALAMLQEEQKKILAMD